MQNLVTIFSWPTRLRPVLKASLVLMAPAPEPSQMSNFPPNPHLEKQRSLVQKHVLSGGDLHTEWTVTSRGSCRSNVAVGTVAGRSPFPQNHLGTRSVHVSPWPLGSQCVTFLLQFGHECLLLCLIFANCLTCEGLHFLLCKMKIISPVTKLL